MSSLLRLRASGFASSFSSKRFFTSPSYDHIIASRPHPTVALLTLNRPKALNALSTPLFKDLNHALLAADEDPDVGAIVLTGSSKAFAAGADIKEMKDKDFSESYSTNMFHDWSVITTLRKPVIAAVSGYALGGGCELAMMCDVILASPTATFGQPEITLGVPPGAGGTQRLTHAIGKSRAMELMLTGRTFSAEEAERWGLVSRIVEGEGAVVEEALKMAQKMASFSKLALQSTKELVNAAYELPLSQGIRLERRIFQGMCSSKDKKEGMTAFAEKRKPTWTHS